MEITLSIKGQELKVLGKQPKLYHGSIGVLYIKFCDVNFDTTLVKTVRFKTEESDWYTADVNEGRVRVPHEVIVVGGFDIAVGGYETKDGELLRFLPTNSVHIDVTENGYGNSDAPLEYEGEPQSVVAKIMNDVEKKADLDYINSLIPKGSAAGDNISLKDHLKGSNLINYRVYGNSVQETRSGRNLFPPFVKSVDYGNGNVITVLEDGGIEIIKKTQTQMNVNTTIELDAGVYTISSGLEAGNSEIYIQLDCGTNSTFLGATTIDSVKQITHRGGMMRIVVFASSASKTDGIKLYPQLLAGAYDKGTLPEYEPYGKMPSKEFPSEIKSVGEYLEEGKYKIPIVVSDADEVSVYVNEPLRRLNDICDYIDFSKQCVVRNIEVADNSGTVAIDESLRVLDAPVYEIVELAPIVLPEHDNVNISVDTSVPASIELSYYQDINKKIAQLEQMIKEYNT